MRTAIVGVGNCLMKDDGVGVHVARALADLPLPKGIEVIDAGTDPDVAFELEGIDRVILVDATRGGEAPGTIYRFFEDVGADLNECRRACHDVGLLQTLRGIAAAGEGPEVVIIGIEPDDLDWGLDLSPVVLEAVPRAVAIVQQELRRV